MDVTGLLGAIERSGGYAAILGLVIVIAFWLGRRMLNDQRIAAKERETTMQKRIDSELERANQNAQEHRSDKSIMIQVVQENSRTNTALASAVEKLTDTQSQTNERLLAIDKHLIGKTGGNG